MKKYLFLTSALVAFTMSGVTEAACIQTPSCSSLGYSSSSSCSGGVKCPFGNAWNCTGPNNTTKINSINTSITNILNRITKLENNSGSGSGSGSGTSSLCESCNVGDYICGGKCYAPSIAIRGGKLASDCTYVVSKKENGVCTRITTGYGPLKNVTIDDLIQDARVSRDNSGLEFAEFSDYMDISQRLCSAISYDSSAAQGVVFPVTYSLRKFGISYSVVSKISGACSAPQTSQGGDCYVNDIIECMKDHYIPPFRIPVESTF